MAVKKKSVNRSKKTNVSNNEMANCNETTCYSWLWAKLSVAAFVLFIITVWDGAMQLVHRIHWGWFLGATIIFCVIYYEVDNRYRCDSCM
jgi:hypothetical protein